ncbi:MAG: YdcH family protein [Pseudomonadota bacterium]
MNLMDNEQILHTQLRDLREQHRRLDEEIAELDAGIASDQLSLRRLKKQKLRLKDEIARIEDLLYPDIIA